MGTQEQKAQKKKLLLLLARTYEDHDDLKVEHAPGTYLACEVCQKILAITAESRRLEAEIAGEVPRTKTPSASVKNNMQDISEFERIDAFMNHFTVEQYAHFRASGMKDEDIYIQLDISLDLFRHWKYVNGLADYGLRVFRVMDAQQRIHYYKAIGMRSLKYLLVGDSVEARKIEELEEETYPFTYVPLSETSATTLLQLVDKATYGLLATLDPSLQQHAKPQICKPIGVYQVLLYDGKNGNVVRAFVKKDTQVLGGKKNKPIQVIQKGRPQASISVGTYIVRAPNGDWSMHTKQSFFELYALDEALIFTQED